jgi:hypothetical protein
MKTTDGAVMNVQIGDTGRLILKQSTISGARLVTIEGNFYFRMEIALGSAKVVIADEELEGLAAAQ